MKPAMTLEQIYLFWTALLVASLWLPPAIGRFMHRGLPTREDYRAGRAIGEMDDLPDWVRRANRAHLNLVEQFGPFAALVLLAGLLGVTSDLMGLAAMVFFWARVLHALVMLSGISRFYIRSWIFAVAWGAILAIAFDIAYQLS